MKKLGISQGVDLSFVPLERQKVIYRVMVECGIVVNMEQSARIKNAVKEGLFNEQWLREILSYKKISVRKVVFNQKCLDSYFEPNMSNEDIEDVIVKFLYGLMFDRMSLSKKRGWLDEDNKEETGDQTPVSFKSFSNTP